MVGVAGLEVPPHPKTLARQRRRRRLLRGGLAVGAVIAIAAGALGWQEIAERRSETALQKRWRCPQVAALATADYALSRPGGRFGDQCLGWIITADHPFGSTDPTVNEAISRIVAENKRVDDRAAGGVPVVRVAVLSPMTSGDGSAMGPREIAHALWGAHAAQVAANGDRSRAHGLRDPSPLVQLVLANSGLDQGAWDRLHTPGPNDQADWPGVAGQLVALSQDRQRPLVAVTGMGISVPDTRLAAGALGAKGLASIGAVVSADDMTAESFFKVSPSNQQYAAALAAAIAAAKKAGAPMERGFLVFDRNPDDNYVQRLKEALTTQFDAAYRITDHSVAFTGSKPPRRGQPHDFAHVVDAICRNRPDIVFYAGRDRDLGPLVAALADRGACQNPIRKFVIATGATGLTLTEKAADEAQLGVLDASSTDPDGWPAGQAGTPAYYGRFHNLMTANLRVPAARLRDGYALMHHDAVAAAVWATRRAMEDRAAAAAGPPSPQETLNKMFADDTLAMPTASGGIYFSELSQAGLWPRLKPVPVLKVGQYARRLATGSVYLTPGPAVPKS
ncbi:hypothetical protein [Pilimelia columellifera]|uniref:ABC transporter substrate-binding protein n=1 Tax=Pilimelia columellifera subsp. columellifera TaxID=706583 RepID=A0ABN3NQL4_9ACTN